MKLFFIPVFLLFASCASQFFIIESEMNENVASISDKTLYQTILISNPPRNKAKLAELIETYNRNNVSYAELADHDVLYHFFRETLTLTRNFEKGKPYPQWFSTYDNWRGQRVGNHMHAYLARSTNTPDIDGQLFYIAIIWDWRDDDNHLRIRKAIDDPDAFYLKK